MKLKITLSEKYMDLKKTITQKEYDSLISMLNSGRKIERPDGQSCSIEDFVKFEMQHCCEDDLVGYLSGKDECMSHVRAAMNHYFHEFVSMALGDYEITLEKGRISE